MTRLSAVHTTHCCPRHGCKYSEDDCPIVNVRTVPAYPENNGCEMCQDEQDLEPVTAAIDRRIAAQVERRADALDEYDIDYRTAATADEIICELNKLKEELES